MEPTSRLRQVIASVTGVAIASCSVRAVETTSPQRLSVGDTYRLVVDAHTGDEASTQPKTDANDGLNDDNRYYQRHNVARAHCGPGCCYWYTSAHQEAGEPNPGGPQWVDYVPPLGILGAGRYTIRAEYRQTDSRASYDAQYIIHHSGGTTTIGRNQLTGPTGCVEFSLGTFDLGANGYVRVNDPGSSSIAFGYMRFTYEGGAPGPAADPDPPHLASDVSIVGTLLGWTAGSAALSHDVHFGSALPPAFCGNQSQTAFDPGRLLPLTDYYWRVDEVNTHGTTPGDTWQFTTGPVPGDFDADMDVDQADFGHFQMCMTGSGEIQDDRACFTADLDHDLDVDQNDFLRFQVCISGANVAADPLCAQP